MAPLKQGRAVRPFSAYSSGTPPMDPSRHSPQGWSFVNVIFPGHSPVLGTTICSGGHVQDPSGVCGCVYFDVCM